MEDPLQALARARRLLRRAACCWSRRPTSATGPSCATSPGPLRLPAGRHPVHDAPAFLHRGHAAQDAGGSVGFDAFDAVPRRPTRLAAICRFRRGRRHRLDSQSLQRQRLKVRAPVVDIVIVNYCSAPESSAAWASWGPGPRARSGSSTTAQVHGRGTDGAGGQPAMGPARGGAAQPGLRGACNLPMPPRRRRCSCCSIPMPCRARRRAGTRLGDGRGPRAGGRVAASTGTSALFLLPPHCRRPRERPATAHLARSAALARARATRLVAADRRRATGTGTRALPALAGAVMMLRREAVQAAGGLFDPGYFMFFEDSDLSRRLRGAGCRLGLVLAASAVHEYRHGRSRRCPWRTAASHYYRKRYPWFHRMSGGLARLALPVPLVAVRATLPTARRPAGRGRIHARRRRQRDRLESVDAG